MVRGDTGRRQAVRRRLARHRRAVRDRVARPGLFSRLSAGSEQNLLDTLRTEKAGGALLLIGAVTALVWANSPLKHSYTLVRDAMVGPALLHLDLTIEQWATDGLLTIFFFVVGLELKREMVAGELRHPATAAAPMLAAVGGMLVPAGIYTVINATTQAGAAHGWAIPTATDIAFAVAVLAVVGRHLPNALRAFLLTLAVVDDLLAIIVIAVFYTADLEFAWLAASVLAAVVFAVLLRRGVTNPALLLPLAVVSWLSMHAFGVHATIAGVVLGFCVPAVARAGEHESLAARFEHRWRPISAGFAVPVFAVLAAGISLELGALRDAVVDPAAIGVFLGLVVGKPVGIVLATWLVARATRTPLAPGIRWSDILGVGMVAGIGFTVSLLIGDLAFGSDAARDEHVRAAILAASLTAALLGGSALAWRNRRHRNLVDAATPE